MVDVVPGLLADIQEEYAQGVTDNPKLKRIEKKIEDGKGTYPDADDYADEITRILLKAYENNLTEDKLPNGVLYYNIAKRIVEPTVTKAYNDVAAITAKIQEGLNQKAGIGIKAIVPTLDATRIDGLIERVLEAWTLAKSVSEV